MADASVYSSYAGVYDLWMEPEMYDGWEELILTVLKEHGIDPAFPAAGTDGPTLADIACGTGQMSVRFAADGFDVTGIDLSGEMLAEASARAERLGIPVRFMQQDMRALQPDAAGTAFDAVVCLCDSLNYMLDRKDLEKALRSMAGILADNGLLILDIHTPYYYRDVLGDDIFADEEDEASFIWENRFDEESMVNRCRLTLFIREGEDGDLFRKHTEHHVQRAYTPEEVNAAAAQAGLTAEKMLDADSLAAPSGDSERIVLVYSRRK